MKAECAGTYRVSHEELGRLLAAVSGEREHRGRRDVICLARAHECVVLEQVLALGFGNTLSVLSDCRPRGELRTFVDFCTLF